MNDALRKRQGLFAQFRSRKLAIRGALRRMSRAYANLQDLSTALRKHVDLDAIFTSINTRLIIQTGVNLKRVKPEQNDDPETIDAVERALERMGIELGVNNE